MALISTPASAGAKTWFWRLPDPLVASPEQVSVSEIGGGNTVVYELKVAKSDIGKVIGKQGKNINAIRTLLGAIAGKTHIRMMLEIIE